MTNMINFAGYFGAMSAAAAAAMAAAVAVAAGAAQAHAFYSARASYRMRWAEAAAATA
jgi:hypothetical protein